MKNVEKNKAAGLQVFGIWNDIKLEDLLNLLTEYYPNNKFKIKGPSIIGQCIFHTDDGPSLHITPSKKLVKCFGNSCGKFVSNPIKFVQYITGQSFSEAITTLRTRLGIKSLPKALVEKQRIIDIHQDHKLALANFFRQKLIDVYAMPEAPEHIYAKPLYDWLKTRGINDVHSSFPIGIIPPLLEIEKYFYEDKERLTWIKSYFSKYLNGTSYLGYLVFFLQDYPNNIAKFKFRKPGAKDFIFVEDDYFSPGMGMAFGLDIYQEFFGKEEFCKLAYVVEGEFDALSSFGPQIDTGSYDHIILALGGNSQTGADFLANLGVSEIYIIGDNDKAGTAWAQDVLQKTKKLPCKIFNWPKTFSDYKDADEIITKAGYDAFKKAIHPSAKNFSFSTDFLLDCIAEDMEKVEPSDIRRKTLLAEEYVQKLSVLSESAEFIRKVAELYNLDGRVLAQEALVAKDSEDLFIERICSAIRNDFHLLSTMNDGRKQYLRIWSKTTRKTIDILLNDEKAIENTFAGLYGMLTDFIKNKVGEPPFLATPEENEDSSIFLSLENKIKKYAFYIRMALLRLSKDVPDIRNAVIKSQGFHLETQDGIISGYLINGKDVYKAKYEIDKITWEHLEGPRDEKILFEADDSDRWLSNVSDISDLEKYQELDLRQIYTTIHSILSTCWQFKHHKTDCEFLAGYIMALPVIGAFKRQTSVIINGEAGSGKSRLVCGLIGGNQFPSINLVSNIRAMDGYTQASVRQEMNNKALALVLDEFEDSGDGSRRSASVRNILDMMRTVISEKAVSWTIGTTAGAAKKYTLRFPLICAAIHPLHTEVDLTRFISIETVRRNGTFPDPVNNIASTFGLKTVKNLKDQLATGMYYQVPKLIEAYDEIEHEYSTTAKLPVNTISRYREALYPVLAVMKVSGLDYAGFAFNFCKEHAAEISQISSESEHETLFQTILSAPFMYTGRENGTEVRTTIRSMFSSYDLRKEIPYTAQGVLYDEDTRWLIIHWPTAKDGVLKNSMKHRSASLAYLKMIAARSNFALKDADMERNKSLIEQKLRTFLGPGISHSHITVYNVSHLIDEVQTYSIDKNKNGHSEKNDIKRTEVVPTLDKDFQV